MKSALATYVVNNADDLQKAINAAIAAAGAEDWNMRSASCVYTNGFDRATVQLETLSDGSKVVNLVFHNATAAQKRRERM